MTKAALELARQFDGLDRLCKVDLIVRDETLALEHRTIVTPDQLASLTLEGFKVALVRWNNRVFKDEDYVFAVCRQGDPSGFALIDSAQWKTDTRCQGATVLGVKGLEPRTQADADYFLPQATYIHFDHSYKGQPGAEVRLGRFSKKTPQGKGPVLLDHEYSVNAAGVRTHAFGHSAGYASTALAMLAWAKLRLSQTPQLTKPSYANHEGFFSEFSELFMLAQREHRQSIRVLILGGSRGRSAMGARQFLTDLSSKLGLNDWLQIQQWGRGDTSLRQTTEGLTGIEAFDLIMNCTAVDGPCPAFMTDATLEKYQGVVQVIGDVSCDDAFEQNRIRVSRYKISDFDSPCVHLGHRSHAVTVNHSPSFFPLTASEDVAQQFFPQLVQHLFDQNNPNYLQKPLESEGTTGLERSGQRFELAMQKLADNCEGQAQIYSDQGTNNGQ